MKNYNIIFLILLVSFSCSNDDDVNLNDSEVNQQLEGTIPELQSPDIILNEIAKGTLGENIGGLFHQTYNGIGLNYFFEFIENTNRIDKIIITDPNYWCEETVVQYHYQENKLIDRIHSIRTNICLEFVVDKVYNYNYKNGYLESIIMDNESLIEKNYFSYNSNGTIATIYSDFRSLSDFPVDEYSKTNFIYDENGNVSEMIGENAYSNTYDKKYAFTYDDNTNIFKGFFVIYSFYQPSFGVESGSGPFFLSNNNITSIKKEYVNNDNEPQYEYFTTNYLNNKLMDYGTENGYQYWERYYINY
jgi:hypothetical protein